MNNENPSDDKLASLVINEFSGNHHAIKEFVAIVKWEKKPFDAKLL